MHTVIRASGSAEFLALVPHLAGFRPRDSLAVVLFEGSRSLGVMRLDLPHDGDLASIAATMVGMMCRVEHADAVVLVVYTDATLRQDDGSLAQQELLDALLGRAHACGLWVKDALCVAQDAWGSYVDAALVDRPLAEIEDRARDTPLPPIPAGADQNTGTALPRVSSEFRRDTAAALTALKKAIRALTGHHPNDLTGVDPRALATACALGDVPELFEDALEWGDDLVPADAAAIIWCFARPSLRDIAIAQWCGGLEDGYQAVEAQFAWEQGADYPDDVARQFWGSGPRPDVDRLLRALALVRECAALAPRRLRPGLLAAAAWMSWALGRSTHADRYAKKALSIEREHGLSEIVMTMVAAGHLPEWAFHRG